MEIGENEQSLLDGKEFVPISYEWALRIVRDKYRAPEGVPIVRIVGKLGELGR